MLKFGLGEFSLKLNLLLNLKKQRFKMKKIILLALFVLIGSISAEAKSNGAEIYQKHCALCHGKDGKKVIPGASAVLAGRDATRLALTIRSYRDQSESSGAYTMHKSSELMKLEISEWSDGQIDAIAKYLSGLK